MKFRPRTALRVRMRMLRWRWRKGRSFGFVLCKQCHHRWSRHFAKGHRVNHPLDPEEWDVEYVRLSIVQRHGEQVVSVREPP